MSKDLMLVRLCACPDIFLGVLIEGPLAAGRAEVVRFSLVLRLAGRGSRVDIHPTNYIVYGIFHLGSFASLSDIDDALATRPITGCRKSANLAKRVCHSYLHFGTGASSSSILVLHNFLAAST